MNVLDYCKMKTKKLENLNKSKVTFCTKEKIMECVS